MKVYRFGSEGENQTIVELDPRELSELLSHSSLAEGIVETATMIARDMKLQNSDATFNDLWGVLTYIIGQLEQPELTSGALGKNRLATTIEVAAYALAKLVWT